jgi:CFEM domain
VTNIWHCQTIKFNAPRLLKTHSIQVETRMDGKLTFQLNPPFFVPEGQYFVVYEYLPIDPLSDALIDVSNPHLRHYKLYISWHIFASSTMYFLTAILLATGISSIAATAITASDMPECALDCYLDAGAKVDIKMMDYERKCLSAPFQLALRECAKEECSADEYEFV